MIFRVFISLALVCALGSLGSGQALANDASSVVAQVAGHPVTREELEQKEATDLLQARYKYYLTEKAALDKLIDQQLLENEAHREKVTVDQLLDNHTAKRVKDPSEDQLEVFYEGLQSDQPYSAMRPQILDRIRQLRRAKAGTDYLKELRKKADVRIALEPPAVSIGSIDAPTTGPSDAPIKIIEFADYQCPYCKKVSSELKQLVDTTFAGKTSLTFADFPLPMHQHAEKAAEAARCAGDQGKYWEYHDGLFDHQTALEVSDLKALAETLKLNPEKFGHCLDSGGQAPAIAKTLAEGKRLGLTGTPSFVINGRFISGATDSETLRALIEQELASPEIRQTKTAANNS